MENLQTQQPQATSIWGAILNSITDKTKPENRLVYGQCPAWVLSLAADYMSRPTQESYPYDEIPARTRRTGDALYEHLEKGNDKAAVALVKRNIDKIEGFLPFGYGGVLKQKVNNFKKKK